jgi:hypothetical protein
MTEIREKGPALRKFEAAFAHALCMTDVRARVLKAMDAMPMEEWKQLFVELRDELDDVKKVAERRLEEAKR